MRGSVGAGCAGSFAGTGLCARRMEAEEARRRATAMRRIFIRAVSRKEAEMKPDCDAQRRDWTGEPLGCAALGGVKEPVLQWCGSEAKTIDGDAVPRHTWFASTAGVRRRAVSGLLAGCLKRSPLLGVHGCTEIAQNA